MKNSAMKMPGYYFDHNATTPVRPEVRSAMEPFWDQWFGNPSSLHGAGQIAAKALREARTHVAALLGAQPRQIVFTSGGTEGNNLALRAALAAASDRNEIVTSAVEHSSVYKLCRQLEKEGFTVHYVAVNARGELDLDELQNQMNAHTAVVTLMAGNNETGVLFPVREIASRVKQTGAFFHVDAVQAAGKIPLSVDGIDFLSISGHKLYAPKGTGALYVREGIPSRALQYGGSQERGWRAGTENVAGAVALGKACQLAHEEMEFEIKRVTNLRDTFETQVRERMDNVEINGVDAQRLPNTSNLRFQGVDGEALLFRLDQSGIAASSGSACMSGAREPSHVLKAMGLSDEDANSSIRFSFGKMTTPGMISESVVLLAEAVSDLRKINLEEQHVH